jgi:NADPH2:quinone reductase
MKAIRVHEFGTPEVMRLEDAPGLKPGKGELVVKTAAIGVNPVDTYLRSGLQYKLQLPFTPGMDCAGVVLENGPGARRFNKGDRVYTSGSLSGAYAQEVLCSEYQVHPLPKAVSFQEGAALGVPYATAYQALFAKAGIQKGETVLIHGGSGGVGIAAIQLARQAGVKIIATAGTKKGLELVTGQGAHHALNHNDPGYLEELRRLTDPNGVNVILEMLADKNLEHDLELVAFRGRIVVIGCRGTIEINPRQMMTKESSVTGMTIMQANAHEKTMIRNMLLKGLLKGFLRPVIGREFPLAQAAAAHHAVLEPGSYGKIILIP